MEILWKQTVPAVLGETLETRPKIAGNSAFLQNFHIRKLGEITVTYTVYYNESFGLLSKSFRKINENESLK